jgi:hypothetical protein
MNRGSRFTSLPCSRANTVRSMKRGIAGLATTLLVSGGMGLAALGLGAGTANAGGPYQWCPGQDRRGIGGGLEGVVWDWSVCHTYFVVHTGQGKCFFGYLGRR